MTSTLSCITSEQLIVAQRRAEAVAAIFKVLLRSPLELEAPLLERVSLLGAPGASAICNLEIVR